jgi:hypothetical protein
MADERCGRLTSFDPEVFYIGPMAHFTMALLADGRWFVPARWIEEYPVIGTILHDNDHIVFHFDSKLDGWVQGPAIH